MNYAELKKFDIANGTGVRVSLFVSGCTHHCKGCFNSEAWSFDFGKKYTDETEQEIIDALAPDYIKGLSLLGGEPFEKQNLPVLLELVKKVREKYPSKTIWAYSGYTFEDDIIDKMSHSRSEILPFLRNIDVLVDGEFVEEKKNLSLKFRGSENQRIIDIRKSLDTGAAVLMNELDI